MDEGLAAAARRFPARRRALDALVDDESFRLLCSDFLEAGAALDRWSSSASPVSAERSAEYAELVESLAGEIAAYLDTVDAKPSDVA
jgi:hypothetical protein